VRINVNLEDKGQWVKVFNPRDATIFVAADSPPDIGSHVRIDLVVGVGGPKIIFRGKVISRRLQGDDTLPKGCSVALGHDEKEKTNYLNGYVRGGLLNLRETRRIPVRLKVTYGGLKGSVDSHTRDINDEGIFVVSDEPLPEESEIHIFVTMPDRAEPYSLAGTVVHTVVVEDEDIPGMGIRFSFEDKGAAEKFSAAVDSLEKRFLSGQLSDDYLV
jgi:Tfp pilus assembly protein PilZ